MTGLTSATEWTSSRALLGEQYKLAPAHYSACTYTCRTLGRALPNVRLQSVLRMHADTQEARTGLSTRRLPTLHIQLHARPSLVAVSVLGSRELVPQHSHKHADVVLRALRVRINREAARSMVGGGSRLAEGVMHCVHRLLVREDIPHPIAC